MTKKDSPIALIPGFMLDGALWDELIPLLPQNREYIRAEYGEADTIEGIARIIGQNLPEKVVLVGFSLGGYIARSLAAQYPDRIAALVLIGTSLRPDTPEQKQAKANAILSMKNTLFKGLNARAIASSLHPNNTKDEALIQRIQEMGARLGKEAFERQSALTRDDVPVEAITCPTLVIAAGDDRLRSMEEVREVAEHIKDADFMTIPDCGHMIPLEQPERLAEILTGWLEA